MNRLCDGPSTFDEPGVRLALLDSDARQAPVPRVVLRDVRSADGLGSAQHPARSNIAGNLVIIDATSPFSTTDGSLFRSVNLRKIPTYIFVNKWDSTVCGPCELIEFIRHTLLTDTVPVNWPVMESGRIHGLLTVGSGTMRGVGPPPRSRSVARAVRTMRSVCEDSASTVCDGLRGFDQVPILFGSALHRFGLDDLRQTLHHVPALEVRR
ncbi:MAG: hypothetical protein U5O16_36515 [Rhodococcus sp. (in: high G+C Gram-positive bacteria)]|uniref:hypothetical protein n=1 Tax=Rhodococcus sp. TaxID=1831 RepID=UPI002ADB9976|nr:hypothetical protein [Rhodococcus sp. (in: high G+C Gram-positive bacteria)]